MSFVEAFLPEFQHEMGNTRKILECIPDNLLDWKANDSLNTIGWVGSHIADTMSWMKTVVEEESFDVAPPDGPPHQTPTFTSGPEILATFDKNLASAIDSIKPASDEQLMQPWSLLQGGQPLMTMPKMAVVKSFLLNHVIHHRAFLISYLRMNDIECPPMYS